MEYISLKNLYHINEVECNNLYNKRFESESSRKLGIKLHDMECFYIMNEEILNLITKILEINNWIENALNDKLLPSTSKEYVILSSLVEEIRSSNKIEGIYSTRKEIQEIVTDEDEPKNFKRFYGMVKKYQRIMSYEFQDVTTSSDIRNLYDEILLEDVIKEDEKDAPDGVIFRSHEVGICSGTKTIHKGVNDEKKILEMMDRALQILNNDNINFLIKIPIFHYLFEYIHPFYNGNGRMGRFLASGYLSKNLNILCAFQLSIACLHNRKQYYDAFKLTNDIRNKSDLTVFIINFLEIYLLGLQELKRTITDTSIKYHGLKQKLDHHIDNQYIVFANMLLEATIFRFETFTMSDLKEITSHAVPTIKTMISNINKEQEIILIDKKSRPYKYSINVDLVSEL